MIWVNPGEFQMGSSFDSPVRIMDEKPHQVKISKGFYLGKYEITQRQYALVMEENILELDARPSRFSGQEFTRRAGELERCSRVLCPANLS